MGNAILSSLMRRGIDPSGLAPGLQQMMGSDAPGADPSMQAPNQPPMPDRSPMTMMGHDPMQQFQQSAQPQPPQQPGMPGQPSPQQAGQPQSEVQMILQALMDRMAHHSKMEKQANQPLPQQSGM